MLCLKTLGGLGVQRDARALPSSLPRRQLLGLLALIAGHDPLGISRDKLLAYIWPESDARHARNSLKQALYALRRSLGNPLVLCDGGMLHLNPGLIDCDVWRFEAALEREDEATAVEVYRGPFLDGFYIAGLDEFERWAGRKREQLRRLYADALRTLAERAGAGRDVAAAVTWWRRLTAVEPLCSTAALGLMRALVAAGDTTSAREHARIHAAYVRAELGGPVSEAVVVFANRLLKQTIPREFPGAEYPRAALIPRGPDRRSGPVALPAAPVVTPRPRPPRRVPKAAWWATAALWAIGLILVPFRRSMEGSSEAALTSDTAVTVAVMPFSMTGAHENGDIASGLEELLAARLNETDGLHSVTISEGSSPGSARLLVRGRVIANAGRLRVTAFLYDRGNANAVLGRAYVEGTRLTDLADALTWRLILERHAGRGERLTRAAVQSTQSLAAVKAYLMGERRFQLYSFSAAIDAFTLAVKSDSVFGLAYYRLSRAAEWDGRHALARSAAKLAGRFSDRLSDLDRRLVEARLVQLQGGMAEAERLYRELLVDYPEDTEAWLQLVGVLFRRNPPRGRSAEEAKSALDQVLTLQSDNREAQLYRARIAALAGSAVQVQAAED